MLAPVTVCTLARGREDRLRNLLRFLARQSHLPLELVIARMQADPYADLPSVPFPVRQLFVPGDALPLARARNAAAEAARGDVLVYLDIDCVPHHELVAAFAGSENVTSGGCSIGEVRYLDGHADPARSDFDDLWCDGDVHPARRFGSHAYRLDEHREFWSLSFAIRADRFAAIGGFDETFEGYGGEDTDFAMSLARGDVPLGWEPAAKAVHQWHPVSIPPLQHLEAIVANANRFRAKHSLPCMEYWTDQLAARGFIETSAADGSLSILRRPSADELEAAIAGPGVRFS